jgi:hypothetical protein
MWGYSLGTPLPVTQTGGENRRTLLASDVGGAFHDAHMDARRRPMDRIPGAV